MKKAFVVSFEQLPAFLLGCYGHQWIETPNFDRLASMSVVFDQHFANDLTTRKNSFPWWTGQTIPGTGGSDANESACFVSRLKTRNVKTTLLLETEAATGRTADMRAQEPFFAAFDQVETVTGKNGFEVSEVETPFARLMQTTLEQLPDWMAQPEDQLVWIRSEGVPQTPLVPEFYATLYLDEVLDQGDEAEPEETLTDELPVEPVLTDEDLDEFEDELDLAEEEDWEELIRAVVALFQSPEEWAELDDDERRMARAVYAGYVTLLDQWLGRFLDQLLEYAEQQSVLLIVTAARGSSELLGPVRDVENWGLFEETTHVPLLIFDSENDQQGNRRQFLSQSADLPATLSAWWGIAAEESSCGGTDLLALIADQGGFKEPVLSAASDQAIAIRTSEFYYLKRREEQQPSTAEEALPLQEETAEQLYQKPTDRWDVYEQHSQHPETVAALRELLEEKQTGTTS
ncbi:Sulfatase [Gimesia panareensis]|uniref:Sulfatase n=1 Tax=Gimesia panareensis TaxID=2527978 RepID=A0A517Q2M2_9PLAN|nr:sulfatase-like hydrolase/transferase [Gimesia panareensis]QDT25842.1 Sulfatase [Gimesia panareensis]